MPSLYNMPAQVYYLQRDPQNLVWEKSMKKVHLVPTIHEINTMATQGHLLACSALTSLFDVHRNKSGSAELVIHRHIVYTFIDKFNGGDMGAIW